MVRGQLANFATGFEGFLMTTESQDLGLTSHPKDGDFYSILSPSLHWGVKICLFHNITAFAVFWIKCMQAW